MKIRRALFSVSDKTGITELAKVFAKNGVELVATGNTAKVLTEAGLKITPIEKISGSPESFQGRMKTLSFPVCSGILYRRGDAQDESDLKKLGFQPIDCVVVNFYPFEETVKKNLPRPDLIEQIDIGGPTLVRSAAKNSAHVLVLTQPSQYKNVADAFSRTGEISHELLEQCAASAWDHVAQYDLAIQAQFGASKKIKLRYGENPHQSGSLVLDGDNTNSPIVWPTSGNDRLTPAELSYNNILDVSAGYALASDLISLFPDFSSVVIIKHNNPCGVASIPKNQNQSQLAALKKAWEGDPTSAFGGVLIFTDPLSPEAASFLEERFVELIAAPGLHENSALVKKILLKRKNLKAVGIRSWGGMPAQTSVAVPGGKLLQTSDTQLGENLKSMTRKTFDSQRLLLARFGIAVCRSLKSNAIAIVRELKDGGYQLIGAGQGQPNRIEALQALAVPRARSVLGEANAADELKNSVMVSDAFFPFRDTVDTAAKHGIQWIVQPGGSIKDAESIQACDEHSIAMAFTGMRHFRH